MAFSCPTNRLSQRHAPPLSHASASNGLSDIETHIENAPCNRPFKDNLRHVIVYNFMFASVNPETNHDKRHGYKKCKTYAPPAINSFGTFLLSIPPTRWSSGILLFARRITFCKVPWAALYGCVDEEKAFVCASLPRYV
jgi:hypothetical protein